MYLEVSVGKKEEKTNHLVLEVIVETVTILLFVVDSESATGTCNQVKPKKIQM